MSTPQRNNYTSPYEMAAVHQTAYPSQSEDYLSMMVGGRTQTPYAGGRHLQDNQQRANNATPNFYRNNYHNESTNDRNVANFYRNNYNSSGDGGTVPYFYQDRTPRNHYNNRGNFQHNRQQRRGNWSGPGRRSYQRNNHNKGTATIADYIHRSMLEDPWAELIERHEAITSCDLKLHLALDEAVAADCKASQECADDEPAAAVKTDLDVQT